MNLENRAFFDKSLDKYGTVGVTKVSNVTDGGGVSRKFAPCSWELKNRFLSSSIFLLEFSRISHIFRTVSREWPSGVENKLSPLLLKL